MSGLPPAALSSNGQIWIDSWGPPNGLTDTEIVVSGLAVPHWHTTRQLRIVVGRAALPTLVKTSSQGEVNYFTARAAVCARSRAVSFPSDTIATIHIELLDEYHYRLDLVMLGTFSWSNDLAIRPIAASPSLEHLAFDVATVSLPSCVAPLDTIGQPAFFPPSAPSSPPTPASCQLSSVSSYVSAPSYTLTSSTSSSSHRRHTSCGPALLHFPQPLVAMTEDWTAAEHAAGRRLVLFTFRPGTDGQRGVVCRAIPAASRISSTSAAHVVSCIAGPDGGFLITSVDVLRLAAFLYGMKPGVEERNRLRRHLERFVPYTIGRHKDVEGLYTRIAMYDEPSPLTINKDVKVFSWTRLEEAMEAMMAKRIADSSSKRLKVVLRPPQARL